ncbi:MAG: MFS transporter [Ignavibacteria bacterium]|nr:MFS transporter [Ignavibacteria bacterium]
MNIIQLPAFRSFLIVRFFIATGWHMQAIVVAWRLYELTKDPLILGMVGLAEALPAIGAALPMGYLVDKIEKRRAIVVATALVFVSACITGLLVQPISVGYFGITATVGLILAMIIINGFARSIYSPAMFSMLAAITPRDLLPSATAVSSGFWQGAMVVGPMLAGIIYGQLGVLVASILVVAFMIVGAFGVIGLPIVQAVGDGTKGNLLADVTQGLRFIIRNQVILGALSLDMLAVLFGGAVAILPVFADQILHTDASGLGVLRAAPSIGSVIMMAFLSVHPPSRNTGKKLLLAVTAFGIATIGFALSETFWLSVGLLVLVGAFDGLSVVVRHTILQLHTPEEMRGRVAAANTMFIASSNEVGSFESGVAARFLGAVPSVVFGGVMVLAVVIGIAVKAPKLRSLHFNE